MATICHCTDWSRSTPPAASSTLCDSVITLTDRWLRPLVEAMKEHLLRQPVIHVDETPMPLQREKRVVKARQWTYSGREPKMTVYDFTEDNQGEHVRSFLAGWRGYLHADAASNYVGTEKLALCRQQPRRRRVRHRHEPDRHRESPRPRPAGLSHRRAEATPKELEALLPMHWKPDKS